MRFDYRVHKGIHNHAPNKKDLKFLNVTSKSIKSMISNDLFVADEGITDFKINCSILIRILNDYSHHIDEQIIDKNSPN